MSKKMIMNHTKSFKTTKTHPDQSTIGLYQKPKKKFESFKT